MFYLPTRDTKLLGAFIGPDEIQFSFVKLKKKKTFDAVPGDIL